MMKISKLSDTVEFGGKTFTWKYCDQEEPDYTPYPAFVRLSNGEIHEAIFTVDEEWEVIDSVSEDETLKVEAWVSKDIAVAIMQFIFYD